MKNLWIMPSREKIWLNGRGLTKLAAYSLPLFFLSLPFTRSLNGVNIVVFTAFFIVLSALIWRSRSLPKSLIFFTMVSVFYSLLSIFHIFPSAWTHIFVASEIPQQSLFAYALAPCFLVVKYYFEQRLDSVKRRRKEAFSLLVIWFFAKVGLLVVGDIHDAREFLAIFGMGSLSALLIAATCIYLSTECSKSKRYLILVLFFTLSILSPFSQNYVFAFVFCVMWLIPAHSFRILILFILSVLAFYSVAIMDPLSVRVIDHNLTVRLVLLRDAIDGFVQTGFIGVGFGTESIRNYYMVFDNPIFADEDSPGFIHLSVHNSFGTILFRLGVLGFLALIFFMFETLRISRAFGGHKDRAVKCSLFAAFFIVSFQNPAFESFVYLYGVSVYLGLIWAWRVIETTSNKPGCSPPPPLPWTQK